MLLYKMWQKIDNEGLSVLIYLKKRQEKKKKKKFKDVMMNYF